MTKNIPLEERIMTNRYSAHERAIEPKYEHFPKNKKGNVTPKK